MPKIKMNRTARGSRNGLTVETFVQGVEYDIPDALILAFQTMGVIEDGEAAAGPLETPENPLGEQPTERNDAPRRGRKPKGT